MYFLSLVCVGRLARHRADVITSRRWREVGPSGARRSQRAGAVLWGGRRAHDQTPSSRRGPEDGVASTVPPPKLGGPGRRRRALGQGQRRQLSPDRSSDVEYRGGPSRLPDTRGEGNLGVAAGPAAPAARGGCPVPKLGYSTPSRAVRDGGRISSFRHGARRAARAKRAAVRGPRAPLRRARGSRCCRGRR